MGKFILPDGSFFMSAEREAVCIPPGRYRAIPGNMKSHNNAPRALLLSVPGRTGIFVHSLTKFNDLKGCIGTAEKFEKGVFTGGLKKADLVYQLVLSDPKNSFITIEDIPKPKET